MVCCGCFCGVFRLVLMCLAVAYLVDGLNNRGMALDEWIPFVLSQAVDRFFARAWARDIFQLWSWTS